MYRLSLIHILDFRDISPKFFNDLKKFNPYGPDNPKPIFCTLRPLGTHLHGALALDIQYHVLAPGHGIVHVHLGRTIEVAHILGILQKGIGGDHIAEGIRLNEVIVHAVLLTLAGRAGSGGYGEIQVITALKQGVQHGASPY